MFPYLVAPSFFKNNEWTFRYKWFFIIFSDCNHWALKVPIRKIAMYDEFWTTKEKKYMYSFFIYLKKRRITSQKEQNMEDIEKILTRYDEKKRATIFFFFQVLTF